jgi:hypothetical protein
MLHISSSAAIAIVVFVVAVLGGFARALFKVR